MKILKLWPGENKKIAAMVYGHMIADSTLCVLALFTAFFCFLFFDYPWQDCLTKRHFLLSIMA